MSIVCVSIISAQDCPDPVMEDYTKVLNTAFAKDYVKCPVIIEGMFLQCDLVSGYKPPKKLKKMFFFQCYDIEAGPNTSFGNQQYGDYFAINKDQADKILSFQKGDKLKLTGSTYIYSIMGTVANIFFVVEEVEKVD